MAERIVDCPGCGISLSLDLDAAQQFQCPQCGKMLGLKRPGAAPPPRAAASFAPPPLRRPLPPRAVPTPVVHAEPEEDEADEEADEPAPRRKRKRRKTTNYGPMIALALGGAGLLALIGLGIAFLPGLVGGSGKALRALPGNAAVNLALRPAALQQIPNPMLQRGLQQMGAQMSGGTVADLTQVTVAMNSPADMVIAVECSKRLAPPGPAAAARETHRGFPIWQQQGLFAFMADSRSGVLASSLPAAKAAIDRLLDGGGGVELQSGHDFAATINPAQFQGMMPGLALAPANNAKDMRKVELVVDISGGQLVLNAKALMASAAAASAAVAKAAAERAQSAAAIGRLPAAQQPLAQAFANAQISAQGDAVLGNATVPLALLGGQF